MTGYLGPRGSFSHAALLSTEKEENICPYPSIHRLIEAAQCGEIEKAFVPIENSIEGAVNITYDMLAFETKLLICAQTDYKIEQNLFAKKGDRSAVKKILSHPQAIAQCTAFLRENYPDTSVEYTESTSKAAEIVSLSNGGTMCIGCCELEKLYNLELVKSDISDAKNNTTRFVVLSNKHAQKSTEAKTSIVFSVENSPGALFKILAVFNVFDINMIKILSRPTKSKLGNYVFFVDIEGHIDEENVKNAVDVIKKKTVFYKFLGSYCRF